MLMLTRTAHRLVPSTVVYIVIYVYATIVPQVPLRKVTSDSVSMSKFGAWSVGLIGDQVGHLTKALFKQVRRPSGVIKVK